MWRRIDRLLGGDQVWNVEQGRWSTNSLWIVLILSLKDRKLLHFLTEECEMVSIGLRSVLMVLKRVLGLLLPNWIPE